MGDIAIVTDTVSDIPVDMAEEMDIKVVPLYIGIDGRNYREGLDVSSSVIYKKLSLKSKVITSAPAPADFMEVYRDIIEKQKKKVIYSIHLSSMLSGTINSATIAARQFPGTRIKLVDTKVAAISEGFIVLEAARAARNGACEDEIDSLISGMIRESRFYATFENFEYVFKGGRAQFFKRSISKALIFKPIISFDSKGKLKLKKFMLRMDKAVLELYRLIKKDMAAPGEIRIGICYGDDPVPAQKLKKMFIEDEDMKIREIILTKMTAVMGAHTGPGIWGIAAVPCF
ncbi:MAG: DegV family protein [Actinobacteria bacterium]|nr:DegV family protein [Actinomycetota bacterium]